MYRVIFADVYNGISIKLTVHRLREKKRKRTEGHKI